MVEVLVLLTEWRQCVGASVAGKCEGTLKFRVRCDGYTEESDGSLIFKRRQEPPGFSQVRSRLAEAGAGSGEPQEKASLSVPRGPSEFSPADTGALSTQ